MGPVDAHISSLLDVPTDKSPAEIKFEEALASYGAETEDEIAEAEFEQELPQDCTCVIIPPMTIHTLDVSDAYNLAEFDDDIASNDESADDASYSSHFSDSTISTVASTVEDYDMDEFLENFSIAPVEPPVYVELKPTPQVKVCPTPNIN